MTSHRIYNCVRSLLEELREKIFSAELPDALGMAKVYGSLAWSNHVNIYSAPEIEDYLFSKCTGLKISLHNVKIKNGKILHVLSECYPTGGHTRVVERLLSETRENQFQDVMIVGLCTREILAKMHSYGSIVRFVKSKGVSAVIEMICLMQKYEFVLLHINPDDIVSTLAARVARERGTKVGLYNHADHCFSYGFKSVDVVFEVSIYGRMISQKYRQLYKWSFAGIPLNSPSMTNEAIEGTYFLSSGPSYKYDFGVDGVFTHILEELIPRSNKKCVLIGPAFLPYDASRKLHEFQKKGLLVVLPPVKHDEYIWYLKNCFAYLDSSPVTGGSALPEAALYGKPCIGLINPIMGYSPIDVIRSKSVEELVLRAIALPASDDANEFNLVQDVHKPSNVLKRVLNGLRGERVFDVPYNIEVEAINSNFMHLKWLENGKVSVVASEFESLTYRQRLIFMMLLSHHGLGSQLTLQHKLSIFFSNRSYRKLRSYPAKRLPAEMVQSIIRLSTAIRDFLIGTRT